MHAHCSVLPWSAIVESGTTSPKRNRSSCFDWWFHIVDYKSTHTDKFDKLKSFDAPYLIGYKRQAEIYSWILSKLGLEIDNTSYFFYVNAKPDQEIFNNSLEFEWTIIPYTTKSYNWVEDTIVEIKNFLETNKIPSSTPDCDLCKYMSKFFDFIKKK